MQSNLALEHHAWCKIVQQSHGSMVFTLILFFLSNCNFSLLLLSKVAALRLQLILNMARVKKQHSRKPLLHINMQLWVTLPQTLAAHVTVPL